MHRFLRLSQQCTDNMEVEETAHDQNIHLWCRVYSHETQYGNAPWVMLQTADDGCTLVQAILYLW